MMRRLGFPVVILTLLAGVVAAPLLAQPAGSVPTYKWSRAEILERAMKRHPLLHAAEADMDVFEAKLKHVQKWWVPTAKFRLLLGVIPGASGSAIDGQTNFDEWGPFGRLEAGGMMPLYTFGKVSSLKRMARAGVDVGRAKKRMARTVVHRQVHEAYSALVVARQYLREIDKAESYVDKAQKTIDKMEETDSDEYDPTFALRLKLVRMEAKSRRLDARKAAEYARDALIELAGLSPEDKVELAEDKIWFSPDTKVPTPERCLELALAARPEQRALDSALQARQAAVDHAKAQLYPDLALGAFVHFAQTPVVEDQGSPFAFDPYNILTGGGGLVLQWNVDLPRHASELSQARAAVRKVTAQQKGFRSLLKLEVRKAHRAVLETRERASLTRIGAKSARGWVTAKLDLFDSGLVPFSEVSEAVKAYFEWRFKSLDASYRARQAETSLMLSLDLPGLDLGKLSK